MAAGALGYAFESSYREFVAASIRDGKGWPVGLCEALAASFRNGRMLEETWFRRYAEIRRELAPSAALVGYEPSYLETAAEDTLARIRELDVDPLTTDVHPLPDGRLLIIDPAAEPPFRFAG